MNAICKSSLTPRIFAEVLNRLVSHFTNFLSRKALKEIMVRDPEKVRLEIDILEELTRIRPHENIIKMCNNFDDNGRGLNKFIVFEYCPVSPGQLSGRF